MCKHCIPIDELFCDCKCKVSNLEAHQYKDAIIVKGYCEKCNHEFLHVFFI